MSSALAVLACNDGVTQLYHDSLHAMGSALQRNDAETLHDLRVAMRHLQVTVENYAEARTAHAKVLPLLKRLINKTNRNRDAEVMLAWLQNLWPGLAQPVRRGAKRWRKELLRRKQKGAAPETLAAPLAHLMPGLAALPLRHELHNLTLGQAAAQRISCYIGQLQLPHDAVIDEEVLHHLRLQAKKVRYLLLPFRDELQTCHAAEEQLRQLQEQLGLWHDCVVCRQSLTTMLGDEVRRLSIRMGRAVARGSMPPLETLAPCFTGLLTLARLNHAREQEVLATLFGSGTPLLINSLQQAVTTLQYTSAA